MDAAVSDAYALGRRRRCGTVKESGGTVLGGGIRPGVSTTSQTATSNRRTTVTSDKPLNAAWATEWARCAVSAVAEHAEELAALDTALGDGDHAANLERGLRAGVAALDAAAETGPEPATPGAVLKTLATTLLATVGGASGPLLGAALLRASRSAMVPELDADGAARILEEACTGIEVRGRAEPGDKTMLDAWLPASRAARTAADAGAAPAQVLAGAAAAAADGAAATEAMTARRGRASYDDAHTRGHRDPGAQSAALLLAAAARAARA